MEARCTQAHRPDRTRESQSCFIRYIHVGRRQLLLLDCFFCLFFIVFKKGFFKSRSFPSEGGLNWETTQGHDLRMQVARFCFPATEEQGKFAPGRSGVRFALWVQEA